jgi:sulfite reductase beta subunit-like hemoprotein
VPIPETVPEGFGGYTSNPQPLADGSALPVLNGVVDPEYDRWLRTNVCQQKQQGYRIVAVKTDQGNLTSTQMRTLAEVARSSGDGIIRVAIDQNVSIAYVPEYRLKQVYSYLKRHDLAEAGIAELDDPVTCPGAYSCNLALTKTMNLGAALKSSMKEYLAAKPDADIARLRIHASGCPNACGQHWTGDFGFYGNARKINGREVPYYLMLLGGAADENGARFGLAIQSLPARLAPLAVRRVLDHYRENLQPGESFRAYVQRHKVETFRNLTADLAKPAQFTPDMYKDWGDDVDFSLELGRGECAA